MSCLPARTVRTCVILAGLLAAAAPLAAQVLDRGEVHGTVRDETGAVLAGAAVTLRDERTSFERVVVTGPNGQYSAPLLPLGVYVVSATRTGFAPTATAPLTLRVGQALVVNVTMRLAGVVQTVSVVAPANTAPSVGGVIAGDTIGLLPVNGRDYRSFALLSPTARTITGARGTFRLAGQPGDYLALNVDGADFTNNFFGEFFGSLEAQNFTIPLEAVQEFEVTAGGAGADRGRSNGGFVNVVTKSGSNQSHGSLAYFLRHHDLTGDDAFGNAPSGLIRHDGGGSQGGPLVRNRTFYFVAMDLQRQTTPVTVRFARDVKGVSVPELGIADLGSLEGQYPRHENVTTLLGKLDHQLTPATRASVRVNFTRNRGDNIGFSGVLLSQATSNLESFSNQGVSVVAGINGARGDHWFVDARAQTSRETRPRLTQGNGPQVQIADTGTFGSPIFLPATQDMYRYQGTGTATYVRGKHDVKFGADHDAFNMRNNAFALALNGAYTFPTLEAFERRQASLYAQNFGLNGYSAQSAALLDSFWQHEFAAYVQDRFRPTSRLTIGAGLRYDMQVNPQPQAGTAGVKVPVGLPVRQGNTVQLTFAPVPQGIPDDRNNWGPRGDVAYDLTGDGKTMVKGSAGVYYGRTPMIYFPLRGSGVSNTTLFLPPFLFGVTFPEVLPSTIAPGSPLARFLGPPAISYVDPGFNNPRVLQMNALFSRRIADLSLEAGYIGSKSDNLRLGGFRNTVWDRNLAAPTQFDAFGRAVSVLGVPRPDPTIAQANALASFGHGRYDALVVSVDKPLSQRWQLRGNYTLSKSRGNGSTERDTEAEYGPSDPFNLDADYGINELDERHQVKAFLGATLLHDITVASVWSAGSGLAFPVYSPTDVNGDAVLNDGFNPDRPVVNGVLLPRFPYHQPAWFTWDLRIGKGIRLAQSVRAHVVLDIFNLLNADNTYADPHTQAILGSPNFRVNNRTLGPRMAQLGVHVDF